MSSDVYLPSTVICRKEGDAHAHASPVGGDSGGPRALDGECTVSVGKLGAWTLEAALPWPPSDNH